MPIRFSHSSGDIPVEGLRRGLRLGIALLGAVGTMAIFSGTAVADQPTVTEFNATFTAVLTDACAFPVNVSGTVQGKETDFVDQSGAITSIHFQGIEQDTFSANGQTLVGEPFHADAVFVFDSSGNVERAVGQGIVEKVRLPDGNLFIAAGRVDFVAHDFPTFVLTPDVGATVNLAGFCAALS